MANTRRYLLPALVVALLLALTIIYRTVELGRGAARPAFLENLNQSGTILGPEGIQFDAQGTLYVGDSQGIIWILGQGGEPRIYARLDRVKGSDASGSLQGPMKAGGLAIDAAGNLYVAVHAFAGGSVLRVGAGGQEVSLFARDMGVASGVANSSDGRGLWVSDGRIQGRLLRYPLNGPVPTQPDQVITGLHSPGGLALGKDEKVLFAAERYTGDIIRVDLTGVRPAPVPVSSLKGAFAIGSLAGLEFDPRDRERRFLYVAENLRGIFTILDLEAKPARIVKRLRLATMGGRPCPASMVIREGYLYFTDLWSCSPIRILLGFPAYREHAYRFQVTDLSSLY